MAELKTLEYSRVWTDPEEFPSLKYSKSWESQDDFPTIETDEIQVRKDMQCLYDEIRDYINGSFRDYVVATGASEEARSRQEEQRVANENARLAAEAQRAALADERQANYVASAVEAKSWAVGGTGSREGEDTNNARYWSRQVQAIVTGDYATSADVNAAKTSMQTYTDQKVAAVDFASHDEVTAAKQAAVQTAKEYVDTVIGTAIGGGY